MFTLYQLKQNIVFRTAYKTPYIIKNFCSLIALAVILLIVYVTYFRADGSVYAVMKILKGLNSSTFNYLEAHKNELYLQKPIPVLPKKGQTKIQARDFFTDCVRLNKPCILRGMSYEWPAYQNWNSSFYFNNTLLGADQRVTAYEIPDPRMLFNLKHDMYSFPK